jgi:hypothetical protein
MCHASAPGTFPYLEGFYYPTNPISKALNYLGVKLYYEKMAIATTSGANVCKKCEGWRR